MFAIIGHQVQKELLSKIRAQTLLFLGPPSTGKRQIARWYAAFLNCTGADSKPCEHCPSCKLFSSDNHPDYFEVMPSTTTQSGRLSRRSEIKIAQLVRRSENTDTTPLGTWLETKPHFLKRVGVIDDAHTLNTSAANAFLKTLEEPPSHAVIILISPSAHNLLATIRSRAMIIRFASIETKDSTHPNARLGRIGDLKIAEGNPEAFTDLNILIATYLRHLSGSLEESLEAADALEKAWMSETHFNLKDLFMAHFSTWQPEQYKQASQALISFQSALSHYVAPSLATQVLTLNLRQIIKASQKI